jgi:ABC-type sugar transport system substrate-binding protein
MEERLNRRLRRLGGLVAAVAAAGSVLAAVAWGGPKAASQEYQYDKKVTICHHTGSQKNPFVTITVSRNALPAHLAHGDTLGPCP